VKFYFSKSTVSNRQCQVEVVDNYKFKIQIHGGHVQEAKEFGLEGIEEVKTRIQQYLVELHIIHR
jgi:hypothetical protein